MISIAMKVLLINTSECNGGAAIAANRLMKALINNGVKARMLVRDKQTQQITVATVPHSPLLLKLRFVWERAVIWAANRFSRHNLFQVDIANTGVDVTSLPEFREADVIHLHWVNQGFLSLRDIGRILDSGKPVVWTMHDQWPSTGICHYSGACTRYETACSHCPLLAGGGGENDLSARVFRSKRRMWRKAHMAFVTCSRWLEEKARRSPLLQGHEVSTIPNTINAAVFHPVGNRAELRRQNNLPADRKLLFFGSAKLTDPRKGFHHLVEACRLLCETDPQLASSMGVIAAGNCCDEISRLLPFPVYAFDYVSDEKQMARLYNMADVFVTPSLEDNLPNTVVEAMSCGIPCVGFRVGGIPEMIDHRVNGYLAETGDAADLAEGIRFALDGERQASLAAEAQHKAAAMFGETHVASKYIALYRRMADQRKSSV